MDILSLPTELHIQILGELEIKDIISIGNSCKTFNVVSKDSYLWNQKAKSVFGSTNHKPPKTVKMYRELKQIFDANEITLIIMMYRYLLKGKIIDGVPRSHTPYDQDSWDPHEYPYSSLQYKIPVPMEYKVFILSENEKIKQLSHESKEIWRGLWRWYNNEQESHNIAPIIVRDFLLWNWID